MKRNWFFYLLISSLMIVAIGCGNSNDTAQNEQDDALDLQERLQPQNGVDESMESQRAENVSQKIYTLSTVELQEFVKDAESEANKVVLMAQIAMEEARKNEIQDFAESVKNAHVEITRELGNIVATNNWYVPDTLMSHHQRAIDQLRLMEGREFDSYYLRNFVSAHERMLEKYQNVAERGGSNKLTTWARSTLPTLRQHLEQGRFLLESMEEPS